MAVCLLFGGSGAIGRFLLPRLLEQGAQVHAVSRAPSASADPAAHWIAGDLDGGLNLPLVADAIFSCGPLDAFARWYASAETGAARVVAVSSMSACSKQNSGDAAERALATRLRDGERNLLAAAAARGAVVTILRPTLVYGAGLDHSLTPIARRAQRWRLFPRLLGANGLRQPVHANDVAAACVAAVACPAAAGRTYELGGAERLGFATMIERTCRSLDVACLAVPVPLSLLAGSARIARAIGLTAPSAALLARLREDLLADNRAAMADLDWHPRVFVPAATRWLAGQ